MPIPPEIRLHVPQPSSKQAERMTNPSLVLLLGVFVLFIIEATAILFFLEGDVIMGFVAIAVIVALVLIVWRWRYATRRGG